MKGPKVSPYNRIPKRIDRSHMEAMLREAARRRGDYSAHLWVTVLALLHAYGASSGRASKDWASMLLIGRKEHCASMAGRPVANDRRTSARDGVALS